ncbi:ribonuclease HII [Vagococcus sp.]|uniref:ribonuclease HII n=1 Tax=Vagococcus sp. TaxID=1933889 RepID=UPI003F9D9BCA
MSKQVTIAELKMKAKRVDTLNDEWLKELALDERKGAQALLKTTLKRINQRIKLEQHFEEMLFFEKELYEKGFTYIAGIDEVGRGPLAGPVVACAVVLPKDFKLIEVNDSKQLSHKKRAELALKIKEQALAIGIGIIDEKTIDRVNIYEATKLAMLSAVRELNVPVEYLLIDAMTLSTEIPQQSLIKGDTKSVSIACASIIAKELRDQLMIDYDQNYPGYGFANNAGYGTKEHLDGLDKYGICPIHRQSFAPVKEKI